MNRLQSFRAYLMYRKAVMMADKRARETRRRFYVMPNRDTKVMLIVTDRDNFRKLRQKGYVDDSMKISEVLETCFYYTRSGRKDARNMTEEELKAKQVKFQLWYDGRLKALPKERKALRARRREAFRESAVRFFRLRYGLERK